MVHFFNRGSVNDAGLVRVQLQVFEQIRILVLILDDVEGQIRARKTGGHKAAVRNIEPFTNIRRDLFCGCRGERNDGWV